MPWGQGIPAHWFEDVLSDDSSHEIKAVRAAITSAAHPTLLFVDGVGSIGSMDFRMDEWAVDVAVTGSQKGFMLPAGLAIVAFSPKAVTMVETATLPRWYFDIRDVRAGYAVNGFPYTPPVGMMNGLKMSTEMLLWEGLENVFTRISGGCARLWPRGICRFWRRAWTSGGYCHH